ncbi:Gat2p [Kluyveromyces lactis]|uniref:KLLA0F17116p n=1 Tax=Kluyveromyces lactis (strain ATCC 8585 / CBS 2359 / DSM 70799 / NBRC 1267 / NRRL Y-1140 / WM37) TaxID=284590 RepID=Q6CJP0_KLULA|nr:uncharacterized protein KLLA0_F17116g [Kluyveromyces lactis]CAG98557.1 KLLA0F17116p [Kluyveromyces lactis]|eukprot:XP_455849.1 uncharacterized protein KLLA0_F17116g [Kluyveromyces lactis]
MTFMETMTASLAQKGSQSPKSGSISSSATPTSRTPQSLSQSVSYHSVASIPNLLNYDRQNDSSIRTNKTSQTNITVSTTGNFLSSSNSSPQISPRQRDYHYGGHYRSGSLDFLADTAIDQDMNQEEFKRILKRLSEYNEQLTFHLLTWSSQKIKDVLVNDLTQLSNETRSMLKVTNRLLELKNMNDWNRKKPQLPSINQLRNELQKPMTEFQFPMRPRSKNVFNVTVRKSEVEIPTAATNTKMEKPVIQVVGHRGSKSDSSIGGTSHTFKVDKVKPRKRNSVSQQQRMISVAAGDGTESCKHCHETVTPEWRRGPYGNRTLCNACGLFYCKLIRKFNTKDANILMHYRKMKGPEDRRVPESLNVPRSFIESLENNDNLDDNFNIKSKTTPE